MAHFVDGLWSILFNPRNHSAFNIRDDFHLCLFEEKTIYEIVSSSNLTKQALVICDGRIVLCAACVVGASLMLSLCVCLCAFKFWILAMILLFLCVVDFVYTILPYIIYHTYNYSTSTLGGLELHRIFDPFDLGLNCRILLVLSTILYITIIILSSPAWCIQHDAIISKSFSHCANSALKFRWWRG